MIRDMKKKQVEPEADVGLIGLAVMGSNLALNMADHRFRVAVQNRNPLTMERFIAENPDTPGGLVGCRTLKELVRAIRRPRRIVMMIKSGAPVDAVIAQLLPLVNRGDVLIDGGNSLWTDTIRRERELAAKGVHFVGSGVSGGEEGARFGPSLMPGGSKEAWKILKPVWRAIAAKVDRKTGRPIEGAAPGKPVRGGVPCAAHIGADGAGHYVKMVHNGIEYGDMQLICEAYFLLSRLLGMKPPELARVFAALEPGRPGLVPDRDHRRHPATAGPGRPATVPGRCRAGHGGPEGHRTSGPAPARSISVSPRRRLPRRSSPASSAR